MVDGVSSATQASSSSWLSQGQQVSTEDFLKLLTLQLRYQNPLEPMKETEFVSQLAQFSELEAQRNIGRLAAGALEAQLLGEAASLLGRTVRLRPAESGVDVVGRVEKVRIVDGVPRLVVDDGEYSLSDLIEVV